MHDLDRLTPEQCSEIIRNAPLIRKWLSAAHEHHLSEALRGEPTPGFKAVQTWGDRSWADPEVAEEYWLSKMPAKDVYSKKLKSPAQMEKIAGTRNWAKAQELIVRPEGKPALVPETDPRPALQAMADLLDDIDNDELDDLI